MGIYVYTLRKNTIKATDMDIGAPVQIGVTEYAYKESYSRGGAYNRMTARMHALAERAREANPNIALVTWGNPKNYDFSTPYSNMAVYQTSPGMEYFCDTANPGEMVGYLYKRNGKFEFERIAA
jgi:hypothetical protein